MPKPSIVYIDGFNFYYGAIKNTKWKWLNLEKFFNLLRQDDNIITIKYFTALIDGSHRENQETYLLALNTLSKVEIILGKFKKKQVKCLVTNCTFNGRRIFQMPEEKRTDVNIALNILNDIQQGNIERVVLVSGDSDLVPALKMAKEIRPQIEIIVYIPANDPKRGAAVELRSIADKARTLHTAILPKAQFPERVRGSDKDWIIKPSSW
jgi:uncharacterized LabA/DUF88 family protein